LLIVDHQSGLGEQVFWVSLRWVERTSLVGEETSCEVIAVDNSEDSCVDIEVNADVEILPDVVFGWVIRVWQLVSLHEDALGNSGVLNSWLNDVDGVVIEVIVDDALSKSVVLVGVFNYWLLEVSFESEDLSVILEPLGGNLGNGVLNLLLTALDTSKLGWYSLGHGHN